jgi:predicted nuclease with TOPRIM domain
MSDKTRRRLDLAILRIQKGRTRVVPQDARLNVSNVAKEAGVSDALLYKDVYSDILRSVKSITGKADREARDRTREELTHKRGQLAETRRELQQLKQDFARLAERNRVLELENEELRSKGVTGKIVPIRPH